MLTFINVMCYRPTVLMYYLYSKHCAFVFITDAGIAAGVGRVQSRLSVVWLFVRALPGKRLELSTPNLVHV